MYYSIPEKDEFSFWNLDILEKIIQKVNFRDDFLKNIKSYPLGLKNLANQMVNNSLFGFIKSNLCDAQKIIPNTLSIEEKTSNIANAIKKFDVIENFVTKTLNSEMPNFVTFLLSESIIKIINEFRASLENSIFTAYTNLNSWKGENLVSFLFQCSGDDLPFLVNKTISYLQYLHEKVLTPVLPKLPQISNQDYLFVENISNEIKKYINGQKNIISVFENFINDLIRWKIEWQNPDIHFSSKEDFFNFHLKSFRKFLILNTNRIIFEQSCKYYNELVVFFNDRLAGKFPFGNLDNCNVLDLIKFLNMYSSYRNYLKSDEEFKKKKLPISLNVLDDLMNFFVVENNNLYINVKIQYHLPEGKNTYLVKNYVSNFGEETYFSDFIDCQVKAGKGFVLGISIINSSRWKIQITDSDLTTKLSSNMRFNFLKEFGFLYFIIENLSRIEDRNVFLKISIPLSTENGGEKSEMILVLKISNYPYSTYCGRQSLRGFRGLLALN